jgi:hypothetical protein
LKKSTLKYWILYILFSHDCTLFSQTENQKIKLAEITKQYFGTNAEDQYISKTIEDFIKTGFVADTLILKTDSSLFYYRAFSENFNPFQIPVSKVEIQFRESVIHVKGEKTARDTLLVLQILGITDSSAESKTKIIEEISRISKEFIPVYPHYNNWKSSKKAKKPYEYFYFKIFPVSYPTLILSFGGYYQNPKILCIDLEIYYKYKAG